MLLESHTYFLLGGAIVENLKTKRQKFVNCYYFHNKRRIIH